MIGRRPPRRHNLWFLSSAYLQPARKMPCRSAEVGLGGVPDQDLRRHGGRSSLHCKAGGAHIERSAEALRCAKTALEVTVFHAPEREKRVDPTSRRAPAADAPSRRRRLRAGSSVLSRGGGRRRAAGF